MEHNEIILIEEPYVNIQGEGRFVGQPMLFVRLQGCPVGCKWCDSYYTWKPFNEDKVPKSIDVPKPIVKTFNELNKIIKECGVTHVWFTGGEPTMQGTALGQFVQKYRKYSLPMKVFHLCTAGWLWDDVLMNNINCATIDVKPPSSGTASKIEFIDQAIELAQRNHTESHLEFKMVVANTDADKIFAQEMINKYYQIQWTLQPLYISEPQVMQLKTKSTYAPINASNWILSDFADWIVATFGSKINVRLGLQLHKHLYPTRSRGI